jgi:hypothetical protein
MRKLALEMISLQTPRGRVMSYFTLSILIFILPYSVLSNLSIWNRIGLDNAPSIGLTRAYWHIMHFDISAAWKMNPLIFLVLIVGLPLIIRDVMMMSKTRKLSN